MKKSLVIICLASSMTVVHAYGQILRGPYIQNLQSNSTVIRWKTSEPSITLLKYSDAKNTYEYQDRLLNKEHLVRLTNLKSDTEYHYDIHMQNSPSFIKKLSCKLLHPLTKLEANCFFRTQANSNAYQAHIWVLGDPGTSGSKIFANRYKVTQLKVRDAYYQYRQDNHIPKTDLILTLGDNVYDQGSEEAYKKGFFDVYREELAHTPIYTTFGNHDAGLNRRNLTFQARSYPYPNGVYYDIFFNPENKAAFYSFNYEGVHFIVLDSHDSFWEDFNGSNYETVWVPGTEAKNKMLDWLKQDLANNRSDWTIVAFHHPPFSLEGDSHELGIWQQWIKVNLVPILETYHVDLVLSGHAHNYQRRYPSISYKSESKTSVAESNKKRTLYYPSFTNNKIQQLAANISIKPTSKSKNYYTQGEGIIYVILGSSGAAFQEVKKDIENNLSFVTAIQKEGSLILDANAKQLKIKFLSSENTILDEFSINKP